MESSTVTITVIGARNLPAADLNGKSDPYVIIKNVSGLNMDGRSNVKTKVIKKNLNPEWNETFQFTFNYKLSKLVFRVYDHDDITSDDFLGKTKVPIEAAFEVPELDMWFPLKNGATMKGELHLKIKVNLAFPFIKTQSQVPFGFPQFTLGLGWDVGKQTVDLDASVIAFDSSFKVLETIYFGHLSGLNGAVTHKGDNRTGEGKGDDEEIVFNMGLLPKEVNSMAIVVNSFGSTPFTAIKSAYVRLTFDKTLGFFRLSKMTDKVGLFFGVLFKSSANGTWNFRSYGVAVDGNTSETSTPQIVNILKQHPF